MKRIPLIALQKAIYEALTQYQTTPVYDDVPSEAELPYITFGAFTAKSVSTKVNDISEISLQLHIWSEYEGKSEVNEIANDVITVLSVVKANLNADKFTVMSQEIDFFEAFPGEEAGYHGVITLVCKIQNLNN